MFPKAIHEIAAFFGCAFTPAASHVLSSAASFYLSERN
jgi:hypothetical protein